MPNAIVLPFPSRPTDAPRARMAAAVVGLREEIVKLMAAGVDVGIWAEVIK